MKKLSYLFAASSLILASVISYLPVSAASMNLILNPSLETATAGQPANWQKGGWGTNNASFSYETTGHTGTQSATVTIGSYTSGDAKWFADPVAATGGTSYTYSDYYQSPINTRIVAVITASNGTVSYMELPGAAPSSTWSQYTTNFTTPTSATKVTMYHLLDKVGTLTIDDVSLGVADTATPPPPPPPPPTPTTVPANASFETANGAVPADWVTSSWGTNATTFEYPTGGAHSGNKSAKVTVSNYTDGDAKWYFNPLTNLTPGDQYSISAWYKTNTQPRAVIMYMDSAGAEKYLTVPAPLANGSTIDWQQYKSNFTVPAGAKSVTLFLLIASNGWLQVDDYAVVPQAVVGFNQPLISLTFDDGLSTTYRNGLPLLTKHGLPSTQYLISGTLNQSGSMTTANVKAFQAQGSEIGSHTVSHPYLSQLTAPLLTQELSQSQATLRNLFGATVAQNIASPYGDYNLNVINATKTYYRSHRSVDVGYNSKETFDPYNIRVQNVLSTTKPSEVAKWVAKAKADKTWLVLVYHAVVRGGDANSVTPTNLDSELANIKASGVPVKTVSQALDSITPQL